MMPSPSMGDVSTMDITVKSPYGLIDVEGHILYTQTAANNINTFAACDADNIFAGSSTSVAGAKDGHLVDEATFNGPTGMVYDPVSARVFIADTMNHKIRFIQVKSLEGKLLNPREMFVQTYAGAAMEGFADGWKRKEARFMEPVGIEYSQATKTLYVVDRKANTLRAIKEGYTNKLGLYTPGAGLVSTIAGAHNNKECFDILAIYTPTTPSTCTNGVGALASFFNPTDVIIYSSINGKDILLMAGNRDNKIRMVTTDGTKAATVTTFAGREDGIAGTDTNVDASLARFDNPRNLLKLSTGEILVTEAVNNYLRLIKVDATTGKAVVSTYGGAPGKEGETECFYGPKGGMRDGPLGQACFNTPGPALEVQGNLLIADTGNNALRVVWRATNGGCDAAESIVGMCDKTKGALTRPQCAPSAADHFQPTAAANVLYTCPNNAAGTVNCAFCPAGLEVNNDYFKSGFHDINGCKACLPYTYSQGSSVNGVGERCRFCAAALYAGAMGCCDEDSPAGLGAQTKFDVVSMKTMNMTSVANDFEGESGYEDGSGAAVKFSYPTTAISVDGIIYVVDVGNNAIRRIDACGTVSTVVNSKQYTTLGAIAGLASWGGFLYVSSSNGHVINRINMTKPRAIGGKDVQNDLIVFAGKWKTSGSDNGVLAVARFFGPSGMASDGQGVIFIADAANNKIRGLNVSAEVPLVWTAAGNGLDYGNLPYPNENKADGYGTNVRFNLPVALSVRVDASKIYDIAIIDAGANRVRYINYNVRNTFAIDKRQRNDRFTFSMGLGQCELTAAGQYERECRNDGESVSRQVVGIPFPGPGSFNHPTGIAFGNDGSFFVADAVSGTIRSVTSNGFITTLPVEFQSSSSVFHDGNDHSIVVVDTTAQAVFRYFLEGGGCNPGQLKVCSRSRDKETNNARCNLNPCTDTPIGTYQPDKNSNVPFYCPTAQYNGSAVCLDCAPGYGVTSLKFGPKDSCKKCQPGFYSVGGYSSCMPCEYARFRGAATCQPDVSTIFQPFTSPYRNGIHLNEVSTFAGVPQTQGQKDGLLSMATFNYPMGITEAWNGAYAVADTANHLIRLITSSEYAKDLNVTERHVYVKTIAGAGKMNASHVPKKPIDNKLGGYADGVGSNALFNQPQSLAYSFTNQILYIADTYNNAIRAVTMVMDTDDMMPTYAVSTLNYVATTMLDTKTNAPMAGNADGRLKTAQFNKPSSLWLDEEKAILYVTDSGNNAIRAIMLKTEKVVIMTGDIKGAAGSSNGVGTSVRFSTPFGITGKLNSSLTVVSTGDSNIRKIQRYPTGHFEFPISEGATVSGLAGVGKGDSTGTLETYNTPRAVLAAYDNSGDVYVADTYNNCIKRVDKAGVSTLIAGINKAFVPTFAPTVAYLGVSAVPSAKPTANPTSAPTATPTFTPTAIGFMGLFTASPVSSPTTSDMLALQNPTAKPSPVPDYRNNDVARSAIFQEPSGLTWTRDRDMLVADSANHLIRVIFNEVAKDCAAGFYRHSSNDSPCVPAPVGYFQPVVGGNVVYICAGAEVEGMTFCPTESPCVASSGVTLPNVKAGDYYGMCEPCLYREYSSGGFNQCLPCPNFFAGQNIGDYTNYNIEGYVFSNLTNATFTNYGVSTQEFPNFYVGHSCFN